MNILAIFALWLLITVVAGLFGMLDFIIGYHTVLYFAPVTYFVSMFIDFNIHLNVFLSLLISFFIGMMIVKDDNIIKLKSKFLKKEWYETAISYSIFVLFLIFSMIK